MLLESAHLRNPQPGDAVPLLLGPAPTKVVAEPVKWEELYSCYGNPGRCGPEMRKLLLLHDRYMTVT